MIRYELARGLAYRRIRHRDMHWYTSTIPGLICCVSLAIFFTLPVTPKLLGSDGLLASTLSVVSTLPGFYFAGLAAVATFSGLNMDRVMPGIPARLSVKVGTTAEDIDLSRRQFLSYLFSYLVLMSFVLCVAIIASNASAGSVALAKRWVVTTLTHGPMLWLGLKFVFVTFFMAVSSSIVVTTLHGMFFLSERIHQP